MLLHRGDTRKTPTLLSAGLGGRRSDARAPFPPPHWALYLWGTHRNFLQYFVEKGTHKKFSLYFVKKGF
jgi:hypothetical protein